MALPSKLSAPTGTGLDAWLACFADGLRVTSQPQMRLARRRHGEDARPADGLDHRLRLRAHGPHGPAHRRATGRSSVRHRHRRRRGARAAASVGSKIAGQGDHLLARYLRPQPRNAFAPVLLDCASGAMDVSDGLVGDLTKMMRVSASQPRWTPPACRFQQRRRTSSPRTRAPSKPRSPAATITSPRQHPAAERQRVRGARRGGWRRRHPHRHVLRGDGAPSFRDASGAPLAFARGSFSHF